ncbi:MAG: tetratricopeptide repeat protein, partial [Candidatus Amulumruptor sp.]|nr:tetratricopeptide repeat protein [Candidatus Amulumruptor sp.]
KGKIAALDAFAERSPTSALRPDAMLEKAESQIALGNNEGAIATYESLTTLYPATAAARQGRLRMAVTRANAGQTDRALADYRTLVEEYPSSAEARMAVDDLKRIYTDRGDVEALTSWLGSVKDAPALDPSDLDNLAFAAAEKEYMESDRTDRISAYLKDYPNGVNYPRALYYMAEAAALENKYDQAYSYAESLLERYPDSEAAPDALLIRADAEAASGKTEAALASYTSLADRAANPSQLSRARRCMLRAATDLERNEVALDAADRILASTATGSADRNEVLMLRGLALDRLGRHGDADTQWQELIKSAPDNINAARAAVERATSMYNRGLTA